MEQIHLETKNLSFTYPDGTQALKNVNIQIKKGEKIAIMGPNGAGKSTLFSHFNGLTEPTSGHVEIDGEKIVFERDELLKVRQKVGIVFQMVCMSGFEDKTSHHLSGGQQKRVAIAGIVAMRPEIMILDEPTAGLDPEGVDKVLDILNNLNKEGISIVISSHDIEMVNHFADKIYVLYDGQIIASGDKHQIFSDKELLKKAHLKAPVTTEILYKLKEKGFNVDTEKISIDETVEEIIKSKKN